MAVKFVCPNIGTLAECRPERGFDGEKEHPVDCRTDVCVMGGYSIHDYLEDIIGYPEEEESRDD